MKLARQSREELEEFFWERLNRTDLRLSEIHWYAGGLSQLLVKALGVSGLTLGRHVFVLSERDDDGHRWMHATLAVHEICHVLQYESLGFGSFLRDYFTEYWRKLKKQRRWNALARQLAYLEIHAEAEAQNAEHDFIRWRRDRNHTLTASLTPRASSTAEFSYPVPLAD